MAQSIFIPSSGSPGSLPPSGGGAAIVGVFANEIILTDAQILSANTVPIALVPSPGVGKAINVVAVLTIKESTAGAYVGNPTFRIRHIGLATDLVTGMNLFVSSANKRWQTAPGIAAGNTTDVTNKGIEISASADNTGGNAANYLVVQVIYCVSNDGP